MIDRAPQVWLAGSADPTPLHIVTRPDAASILSEPAPLDVDHSWSDGLDCTNSRCSVIRSELYLVP
jgi:hypothetical protein